MHERARRLHLFSFRPEEYPTTDMLTPQEIAAQEAAANNAAKK